MNLSDIFGETYYESVFELKSCKVNRCGEQIMDNILRYTC